MRGVLWRIILVFDDCGEDDGVEVLIDYIEGVEYEVLCIELIYGIVVEC